MLIWYRLDDFQRGHSIHTKNNEKSGIVPNIALLSGSYNI